MKRHFNKKYWLLIIVAGTLMYSCKRDQYFLSSGLHDPKVNETTYDYLKNHPYHLFDTLILLIDKAGLQSTINGNVTFFAPTDYCIDNYIRERNAYVSNIDASQHWTFDSLMAMPVSALKDTLLQYVIPGRITRDTLTKLGGNTDIIEFVDRSLSGNIMVISVQKSNDYTDYSSVQPRYFYYTKIIGGPVPNPFNVDLLPDSVAITGRCQTSGIITTNGILHVMDNYHVMGFNQIK